MFSCDIRCSPLHPAGASFYTPVGPLYVVQYPRVTLTSQQNVLVSKVYLYLPRLAFRAHSPVETVHLAGFG